MIVDADNDAIAGSAPPITAASIISWWVRAYEDPIAKIACLTSGAAAEPEYVDPDAEIRSAFPGAADGVVAAAVAEIVGDSCRKWVKRGMIVP